MKVLEIFHSIDGEGTRAGELATFVRFAGCNLSCKYCDTAYSIKPKPEAVGKTPAGETIWRCRICGYEYVGEELPEDFICPVCKHPAEDFEKVVR